MYIYPRNQEKASKSHWTVKLLRAFGVLQIISFTILGFLYSGSVSLFSDRGIDLSSGLGSASFLVPLLGTLIGLIVGIITSVGTFAVALVVDDIHVLRVHSEALLAFEEEENLRN